MSFDGCPNALFLWEVGYNQRTTMWVAIDVLAYGVAVGFMSIAWHQPRRDMLLPLNFPGELIAETVYVNSIRLFGDLSSPQAHFTIPWLLRMPQVTVPASAAFWGAVGLLVRGILRRVRPGPGIPQGRT